MIHHSSAKYSHPVRVCTDIPRQRSYPPYPTNCLGWIIVVCLRTSKRTRTWGCPGQRQFVWSGAVQSLFPSLIFPNSFASKQVHQVISKPISAATEGPESQNTSVDQYQYSYPPPPPPPPPASNNPVLWVRSYIYIASTNTKSPAGAYCVLAYSL